MTSDHRHSPDRHQDKARPAVAADDHDHDHDHGHGHGHEPAHGHGHSHDHSHAARSLLAAGTHGRVFAWAIALNLAFVGLEAGVGWWANSLALLADAGHNLGDVAGLIVAWVGMALARRQADERRSYGLRRASILASLINAVLLLLAMGGLGWEAATRLAAGATAAHGVARPDMVMLVAAAGVFVNGATAWLFARDEGDINLRGAFLHMAGDALVSLGVVVSGGLTLWLGWWWLDALTSLLITLVIIVATWSLLTASLHLMVDGVPANIDLIAVRRCLEAVPGVASVHDLHVWALASSENALTAHLVRGEATSIDAGLLTQAHASLRERFGIDHTTLQIESADEALGCPQREVCGVA
jgi:cobalt-zinc-cadmium efflux system protein